MKKTALELLQKRLKDLNSQLYSAWKINSHLQIPIKGEIKGVKYALRVLREQAVSHEKK